MNRKAICLLIWATMIVGCSSISRMAGVKSQDPAGSPPKAEKTPSPASVAKNRKESSDQLVQKGQAEISAWYRDQQPQHLPAARSRFEEVLVQDAQNPQAHHGLAIVADLEKDFARAERHYQQALVKTPGDSDILGDLGYSYLLQDRLSESERYSLMALQANQTNQKAAKHLADVYARQGKPQKAEEVYAKILPASEVQKALSENAPRPPAREAEKEVAHASLLDKLRPNKPNTDNLANELQKRQQDRDYASAQQNMRNSSNMSPQERLAYDAHLRRQLTEIDQEANPQAQMNGPILIDDQTRQVTRLPGSDANMAFSQGANSPMSVSGGMIAESVDGSRNNPPPHRPGYGEIQSAESLADRQRNGWPVAQQNNTRNLPQSAGPPVQRMAQSSNDSPVLHYQNDRTPGQGNDREFTPNSGMRPWNGVPLPPDYAERGMANQQINQYPNQSGPPGNRPADVIPAVGQQHPGNQAFMRTSADSEMNSPNPGLRAETNMYAQQGQPASNSFGQRSLPQGMSGTQFPMAQQPGNPEMLADRGNGTGEMNSFREASKAAARLGMGLMPEGQSSNFSQAAPVLPPGTMSYQSANVAAPQRMLPDERPLRDLNQAYQPDSLSNQSPPYNREGQLPQTASPMYSRQQYDNMARQDSQTMRNSNIPQSFANSMEGYEAQRWDAGREANRAVQQVWAQGPVNSQMSPSAGSQYTYPNSSGPMFMPNPQQLPDGTRPPAWPHAQPAIPDESVIAAQNGMQGPEGMTMQQRQEMQQPQVNSQYNSQTDSRYQVNQQQQQQQFGPNVTIPPAYQPGGAQAPASNYQQPPRSAYAGTNSYDNSSLPTIRPR